MSRAHWFWKLTRVSLKVNVRRDFPSYEVVLAIVEIWTHIPLSLTRSQSCAVTAIFMIAAQQILKKKIIVIIMIIKKRNIRGYFECAVAMYIKHHEIATRNKTKHMSTHIQSEFPKGHSLQIGAYWYVKSAFELISLCIALKVHTRVQIGTSVGTFVIRISRGIVTAVKN